MGCDYVDQLILQLQIIMMRIRSNFFKREYDLNKAELIGQGNFAQVYRAFEPDLNDSIAIRRVKKSQADMDDIRKEKQINDELRKVQNENILKIYDIIDLPEAVWYITEYCSGGSLWDALNLCKDNKMSQKEGLECVLQISRGVQELHNHRITHRDLKPQNILLKTKYASGKPLPLIKLADFGLSTQKIIMETIAGTKEYIAPEQAKFHNYTNAVDVWSLGIIFDEILHGNPYYSGEDNKEVFNKILKMPFKVRDESLRPSIKELMVSLLKKKPYERPIIAVIRTTVEKILEQIQAESKAKTMETAQRKLKSRSSNASSANDSLKSSQAESKPQNSSRQRDNPVNESRKVYGVPSQQQAERPPMQRLFLKKQLQVTPNNRSRVNPGVKQNELSKNLSGLLGKKQPEKVMTINEIRGRKDTEREKDSEVTKLQRSTQSPPNSARQSISPPVVTPVPTMHLNDKVSLYKGARKGVASSIKKDQFKGQVVDINKYMSEVFQMKKEILDHRLMIEKGQSFLLNTQMVGTQFAEKCQSTDEIIKGFRKQMDFLNYFSTSEDYEIRLLKGQAQLPAMKERAKKQIEGVTHSVEEIFFRQLDSYVDAYLERVIK